MAEVRPRLYEVPRTEEPAPVQPPPAAEPVNAELELMRAELAAMRQQFSALPAEQPRRRRRKRFDVIKGVRLTIWLLAIVGAALVAFNMLKTPENAAPKQDHILAAAVGG